MLLPPISLILLLISCFPFLSLSHSSHVLLTTYFTAYSAFPLAFLFLLPTSCLSSAPSYLVSRLFCFLTLAFSYSAVRPLPGIYSFLSPSPLVQLPTSCFPYSVSRHLPGICSFLPPFLLILLPTSCFNFLFPISFPSPFYLRLPLILLPTSCFPYSVSKISKVWRRHKQHNRTERRLVEYYIVYLNQC